MLNQKKLSKQLAASELKATNRLLLLATILAFVWSIAAWSGDGGESHGRDAQAMTEVETATPHSVNDLEELQPILVAPDSQFQSSPRDIFDVNGTAVFTDGGAGARLYKSDGTEDGTMRLFLPTASSNPGLETASVVRAESEQTGRTVTIANVGSSLLNSDLTVGTFFSGTAINDTGQVLFRSQVQGTDNPWDDAVFIGSPEGLNLVAVSNQELPNGGTLAGIRGGDLTTLDNTGDVAFMAGIDSATSDDRGVFVGAGDGLTQYARVGQQLPGDGEGTLTGGPRFGGLQFNDVGQAIFTAGISDEGTGRRGIFLASDMGMVELVREGSDIPHGVGFVHWSNIESGPSAGPSFSINTTGQVLFNALVNEQGVSGYRASFISTNGILSLVSSPNDPLLLANGERIHFLGSGRTSINDDGVLMFRATIRDVNGDPIGSLGYYHLEAGQLTELVREGDTVPGGDGTINTLNTSNKHNNVGQLAFRASVSGGPDGVYRASPDGLVQISRVGDPVADDATINSFHPDTIVDMTDSGTIAYRVALDVDGVPFSREAIFLSDGIDTVRVAQQGIEVNSLNFVSHALAGLNKHGQVAYRANGTGSSNTQIVNLFTPNLYYRVSDDGSFDDGMNWTLSLEPSEPHDVTLASDSDVRVTADTGTRNVNSLQVGGQSGQATLHLTQNSIINVAEQVTIKAGGTLSGEGSITGDVINAAGLISPGSSPGIFTISGNVTQGTDATLLIEIGGLNAGADYDVLEIGDHVQLGGELILRFIDGFAPSEGDVFDFMQVSGDTIDDFEQVTIENLLLDFEYSVEEITNGSLVALNDGTFSYPGEMQVSKTELDFGAVTLGNAATLDFTVSNPEAADAASLELSEVDLTGDGEFALTGGDCEIGTVIDPGEDCSVEVTFAPSSVDDFSGQVLVASTDGQSATVALSGEGVQDPAGLSISPTELDFGEVATGSQAALSFTVSNAGEAGSASIELGTLAIDGSAAFEISGGDCAVGTTLQPGESCDVEVRFAPDDVAAFSATAEVTTTDAQSATVDLSGEGLSLPDQIFQDRFETPDD